MTSSNTCYMCDSAATSEEHVPPKCVFPKRTSLRKNLIKVPSCDVHNLRKSKDDELLRHILASAPANNQIALDLVHTVLRSFDRRPHIIGTFLPDLTEVTVGDTGTASFTIDLPRFTASIESVVRALHFNVFGKKLLVTLRVAWSPLMTSDLSETPFLKIIQAGENYYPPMRFGDNKEVFQFDFHSSNDSSLGLCRLRFYEGHPFYVTWRNVAAESSKQ